MRFAPTANADSNNLELEVPLAVCDASSSSAPAASAPDNTAALLRQRLGHRPRVRVLAAGVALAIAPLLVAALALQAGTVRGLAVSGAERSAEFPNLPTVAEALSLPGYRTLDWHALAGPAGLPADRRARIAAAFHHALARPELAQRLQAAGATPAPSTPQQMEDFLRAEIEHYTALARSTGIKAE